MIDTASTICLLNTLQWLLKIINSNAGIAAIGSFAGALGGYVIVWGTDNRKEIRSKIEHAKQAFVFSVFLFNTATNLKKNQLLSIDKIYTDERNAFLNWCSLPNPRPPARPTIDRRNISFPFNIEPSLYNSILLEKFTNGNIALLCAVLVSSINEMRNLINLRHEIDLEINNLNIKDYQKACRYYGVLHSPDDESGKILDERYKHTMEGIKGFGDDIIWFSKTLITELIQFQDQQRKQLWLNKPKLSSINFPESILSLIPSDDNYKDWIKQLNNNK